MNATSDSGALATCASPRILPFSPRTQIAVLASDTSRPTKTSMSLPFPVKDMGRAFGKTPRTRYACKDNDTRISAIANSSNVAGERRAPLRHLCHGRRSVECPAHRSNQFKPPVRSQGPTPIGGQYSKSIDKPSIRASPPLPRTNRELSISMTTTCKLGLAIYPSTHHVLNYG